MSGPCDRLLKRSVKNLRTAPSAHLWLQPLHQQKSDPIHLRKLSNDYPDARFVNLLRNPIPIRSLALFVFRHQECFCFLSLISLLLFLFNMGGGGEAAVGL